MVKLFIVNNKGENLASLNIKLQTQTLREGFEWLRKQNPKRNRGKCIWVWGLESAFGFGVCFFPSFLPSLLTPPPPLPQQRPLENPTRGFLIFATPIPSVSQTLGARVALDFIPFFFFLPPPKKTPAHGSLSGCARDNNGGFVLPCSCCNLARSK